MANESGQIAEINSCLESRRLGRSNEVAQDFEGLRPLRLEEPRCPSGKVPYRFCHRLVGTGQIPSVPVGRRRPIDVRWVDQWLAGVGYRPSGDESSRGDTVANVVAR